MKTLLTLAMLISTTFGIKTSYFVLKYENFADHVIEKHETFDKDQWTKVLTKYNDLRSEYKELSDDMSKEEKQKIDNLNYKINAIIIRNKASMAFDEVEGLINEVTGTLKELFK